MTQGAPEPKKVVHRVVKRTVVRPVTPTGQHSRTATPTKARTAVRAPKVEIGAAAARAGGAIGQGAGKVGTAVTETGWAVRDRIVEAGYEIRSWRIPPMAALPASIITGLVCGIVVTAIGGGLLAFFEWSRGTSTGGGWWGSLSIAGLIVGCFFLGSWLLREFGSAQPRGTSLLAVVLALTGTLVLVEPANGPWAGALMPFVILASYVAAQLLTDRVSGPETHH